MIYIPNHYWFHHLPYKIIKQGFNTSLHFADLHNGARSPSKNLKQNILKTNYI